MMFCIYINLICQQSADIKTINNICLEELLKIKQNVLYYLDDKITKHQQDFIKIETNNDGLILKFTSQDYTEHRIKCNINEINQQTVEIFTDFANKNTISIYKERNLKQENNFTKINEYFTEQSENYIKQKMYNNLKIYLFLLFLISCLIVFIKNIENTTISPEKTVTIK